MLGLVDTGPRTAGVAQRIPPDHTIIRDQYEHDQCETGEKGQPSPKRHARGGRPRARRVRPAGAGRVEQRR